MTTNKIITLIASSVLAFSAQMSIAKASTNFDVNNFTNEQQTNIDSESNTYNSVATQSLNDLQAFLKKNPLNDEATKNQALPPNNNDFKLAPPPPQNAPAKPAANASSTTESQAPSSNLPISNGNENNTDSSWNYKL